MGLHYIGIIHLPGMDVGLSVLDFGLRVLDLGFWIHGLGFSMKSPGLLLGNYAVESQMQTKMDNDRETV